MHPLFRFTLEMDAPNPDPAMERAALSLADSEATFRRGETNLELGTLMACVMPTSTHNWELKLHVIVCCYLVI